MEEDGKQDKYYSKLTENSVIGVQNLIREMKI